MAIQYPTTCHAMVMSKHGYSHGHNQITCTLGVKNIFSARFWTPTAFHRKMARFLTQWAFHRVPEHPKQSSDKEVMVFSFKTGQFTLLILEIVCDTRF